MRSLIVAALVCLGAALAPTALAADGFPPLPPDSRVAFDASPYLGKAPLTVRFDASRSLITVFRLPRLPGLGAGDPLSRRAGSVQYMWSFGDGAVGLGRQVAHTYTAPGDFTVRLLVANGGGAYGSASFVVTVADGAYKLTAPVSENEARRFLWQAAFGPKPADIAFIASNGYEAWIDAQIAMPPTAMTAAQLQQAIAQGYGYGPEALWDDFCVEAPDQLRQRMAWALSQILVMNNPQDTGSADTVYYGVYIQRALGNYRDLLGYVTRSHQMGVFLTYINNARADPQAGAVPDENYAREVMQLFSIGLWALNPDGSRALDAYGEPIPTYTNATIQQFARIFTGFRWGPDFSQPMNMSAWHHEFGSKQLLNYPGATPPNGFIPAVTIPAQQTTAVANADVDAALDNIFRHPNCPPFIADLLIKRMTTSNPTPGYVRRVADAFAGIGPYGTGVRGDLTATAKAILLDDEARDPAYRTNPFAGRVKEPLVTRWALYRILQVTDRPAEVFPFRIAADTYLQQQDMGQSLMGAPSVFNFYLPAYIPPLTELSPFAMFSPELQIYNDYTALATQNRLHDELITRGGATEPARYNFWRAISNDVNALVNALNDELLSGALTAQSRQIITAALTTVTGITDRVRSAAWLFVNSPEFRTLK